MSRPRYYRESRRGKKQIKKGDEDVNLWSAAYIVCSLVSNDFLDILIDCRLLSYPADNKVSK